MRRIWSSGGRAAAFVAAVCAATGAAGAGGTAAGAGTDAALPRADPAAPNFVVVLADDLDAVVSPYWEALPQTAARVRDAGMTFTNAYVASPNCCPSRSGLLTGQYPHNNGVFSNFGPRGGWAAFRDGGAEGRTVAVALHDAGYRTMLAGKYLNGYDMATAVPPGWDEWYATVNHQSYIGYNYTLNENGTLVRYGSGEADYVTDVLAGKAVDFVERAEADDERPFFALVAPTAPHTPLGAPVRYLQHPWKNATAPRPVSYAESDKSDKPLWLRMSAGYRSPRLAEIDPDYRRRMGSLLALDDLVAGLLDALESAGELDRTYVVFTSDNGYNFGAHGLVDKLVPYEESIKVPLAILGPGVPSAASADEMVHNIDLAPTLLDLAGLGVPDGMDGRSLAPLLAGEHPPWRTDLLIEYETTSTAIDPAARWLLGILFDAPSYRAVRSTTHLFVEWDFDGDFGAMKEYELYDMQADPSQLTNLLAAPDGVARNITVVISMLQRLAALGACAGSTCH